MKKLPLEIDLLIIEHLQNSYIQEFQDARDLTEGDYDPNKPDPIPALRKKWSLAPLATVSALWRDAIEKRTFRSINIKDSQLSDLSQQISAKTIRRCLCLHYLQVTVEIGPRLIGNSTSAMVRHEMADLDRILFLTSLKHLHQILLSWSDALSPPDYDLCNIELTITVKRPRNEFGKVIKEPPRIEDSVKSSEFSSTLNRPCFSHITGMDDYLQPAENGKKEWPQIPIVKHLRYKDCPDSKPQATAALLPFCSSLKPLKTLSAFFAEDTENEVTRYEQRSFMIKYLSDPQMYSTLAKLSFGDVQRNTAFGAFGIPGNANPTMSNDGVCVALRKLSTRLESLRWISLHLAVSNALFWPQADEDMTRTPHWPHLERYDLKYAPVLPNDIWRFLPDNPAPNSSQFTSQDSEPDHHGWPGLSEYLDDSDADDEIQSHRIPIEARVITDAMIMDSFYLHAALAVSKMPKIKEFNLKSIVTPDRLRFFCYDKEKRGSNLWLKHNKTYTPSISVMEAWYLAKGEDLVTDLRTYRKNTRRSVE